MARQTSRTLPAPGGCPCQGRSWRARPVRLAMLPTTRGACRDIAAMPPAARAGTARPSRPARPLVRPAIALNCCDSLVAARYRTGGDQVAAAPWGPERGAAGPARAAPASRPRGGRRIRRIMEGRPEVPGLRTSTAQIARLLSIRPAMDCSDSRTRHQVAAVSGRRTIRMKSTASCHLRLSPGVTGTPWAPPAGRVRPRGRVTPGRSARCRPARAGPPAPRLRRAPGRAGRPGRTGP
jgi:hypothetical protein